jgi:hypothetical protein
MGALFEASDEFPVTGRSPGTDARFGSAGKTRSRRRVMFASTNAFSGFAVDDVARAREFYSETLGLKTSEDHGLLTLHLAGDRPTLVYPKPDHIPANYTILNFAVGDIDERSRGQARASRRRCRLLAGGRRSASRPGSAAAV